MTLRPTVKSWTPLPWRVRPRSCTLTEKRRSEAATEGGRVGAKGPVDAAGSQHALHAMDGGAIGSARPVGWDAAGAGRARRRGEGRAVQSPVHANAVPVSLLSLFSETPTVRPLFRFLRPAWTCAWKTTTLAGAVGRGDGGAGHGTPRSRRHVPSCLVLLLRRSGRQARLPSVVQGPPGRLFTAGNVDRSASRFQSRLHFCTWVYCILAPTSSSLIDELQGGFGNTAHVGAHSLENKLTMTCTLSCGVIHEST